MKNITMVKRLFAISLCAFMLSSCGWQLRGSNSSYLVSDSTSLTSLQLIADQKLVEIKKILADRCDDIGITLSSDSTARLTLQTEKVERRPLSYSSTGIPLQYQITMSVRYRFRPQISENYVEERTLVVRRNYDFDTELIVAKDEEERQLLDEMRQELSSRILANAQQFAAETQP